MYLNFSKVAALVAASLIILALAYADHGKWNKGNNDEDRWGERDEHQWGDDDRKNDRDRRWPVVPEANAAWLLAPFFGAVLLFSARHSRANPQNSRVV
jgi:hypothetical protein